MTTIGIITERLQEFGTAEQVRSNRVRLKTTPDRVRDAITLSQVMLGCDRLVTISTLDRGTTFELLYHLTGPHRIILSLSVSLPRDRPSSPTVSDLLPPAGIYERQIHDLFGIMFPGHPDLKKIILNEDWPERVPAAQGLEAAARIILRRHKDGEDVDGRSRYPHRAAAPCTQGTGNFRIIADGEKIVRLELDLSYNHRGIEKAAEQRNFIRVLPLLERVCGICSHSHATAFAKGIEEIMALEIPPRARYIRTIIAELERMHSHLLWLGVAGHEIGFNTLFMWTWRDREAVQDTLEEMSGNRVHYSMNEIGGVRCD